MRVSAVTAMLGGVALAAAAVSNVAAADVKKGGLCHVVCSDTPAPPPPPRHVAPPRRAPVRHVVRHRARHYARHDYYDYRQAEQIDTGYHDQWQPAPNDAMLPGPGYYQQSYAQGSYCDCNAGEGLQIDRYGWSGGVGYAASGGGFVDGYGMVHFGGGGFQNGPTYNSYAQSFQFNPSRPGPFQPRVMGGFAAGGPHVSGGFGFRR
jgi:hypothetical protein